MVRHRSAKRLFILLTAALFTFTPFAAEKADAAPAALSKAQKAQVQTAAIQLGFTADQAKAIAADPKLAAGIPVAIKVTNSNGSTTKSAASRGSYAASCRTKTRTIVYTNVARVRLVSFNLQKHWCWNGITVLDRPEATAWGAVTATGAATGWTYEGVVSKNQYDFMPQNGGFWGTQSSAQASFRWCAFKVGCVGNKYPRLVVNGYGNGAYNFG